MWKSSWFLASSSSFTHQDSTCAYFPSNWSPQQQASFGRWYGLACGSNRIHLVAPRVSPPPGAGSGAGLTLYFGVSQEKSSKPSRSLRRTGSFEKLTYRLLPSPSSDGSRLSHLPVLEL